MFRRRLARVMLGTAAVVVVLLSIASSRAASAGGTASPIHGVMDDVSCQPGQCVGIGFQENSKLLYTGIQSWTLSHGVWSVATQPSTASKGLMSVSCPQHGMCVGVGYTIYETSNDRGFAERLDAGVWQETLVPASGSTFLRSVSCVSPTWCVAVGSTSQPPISAVLLQWNGTTWSHLTTPLVMPPSVLDAVSCLSLSDCMAVGFSKSTLLAEEWNGSKWTVVTPYPQNLGQTYYAPSALSCTSSTSCLAVGGVYTTTGRFQGVAWTWDGNSWTYAPTPPFVQDVLTGVSCTSPTACLVVGSHSPSDAPKFPPSALVEQWNGATMSPVAGAALGQQSALDAVSCSQANWCVAVGSITIRVGGVRPLIERWNGSTLNRMGALG